MARRNELEYELAQIELDKQQLRLEERQLDLKRKELELKQKLTRLDTVDLTEDDVLVKSESPFRTTGSSRLSSQGTTSTEPTVDEITVASITKNPIMNDDTIVVEKPVKLRSSILVDDSMINEPSAPAREDLSKQADPIQQDLPLSSISALPSPDPLSDGKDLLTKFLGLPPEASKLRPHTGSKRTHLVMTNKKEATGKAKIKDWEAIKSDSGESSRPKRKRISREKRKQETENSGAITQSERYKLVSHYADLFLKHMQAAERELDPQGGKNTIASRVRQLNVGKTHPSITSLHREFNEVAIEHAKSPSVRSALQAELDKFENALPYWSPKCKGLSKQDVRLSMLSEIVQKIANGEFDIRDYEDGYDGSSEI